MVIMNEQRKTINAKVTQYENDRINRLLERYEYMNKSDIVRIALWRLFDAEFDEDNHSEQIRYVVREEIKLMKEEGLI